VQLRHPPVAGSLVQPVDVLAYEVEGGEPPLQLRERLMASVGFGKLHKFATPLVPFPDESGVAGESLGGRELLGIESLPEAGLGLSERRDAALRGGARARERGDALDAAQCVQEIRRKLGHGQCSAGDGPKQLFRPFGDRY